MCAAAKRVYEQKKSKSSPNATKKMRKEFVETKNPLQG